MATCPNGHTTTAIDYCDVCGAPMPAGSDAAPVDPAVAAEKLAAGEPTPVATGGAQPGVAGTAPSAGAEIKTCPVCHAANPGTALFCEACGYDFTTGSLPRPSNAAPEGAHPTPKPAASSLDLDAPAPAAAPVPSLDLDAPAAAPVETPAAPAVVSPAAPAGQEERGLVPPTGPLTPPEASADDDGTPNDTDAVASDPAGPQPDAPAPAPTASDVPVGKAEWVAEVWIDPDWYAGQDSPDQLPSPGLPRIVGLRKRTLLIGRPSKSRGITPDLDCEPDTGVSRKHAELSTDGTRWWVEDLGSSNGTFVGQAGSPLPQDPITGRTELGEDARVYVGSWTRIVVRKADPDEADL